MYSVMSTSLFYRRLPGILCVTSLILTNREVGKADVIQPVRDPIRFDPGSNPIMIYVSITIQ